MKKVKIILVSIAILLFVFNYQICEFFYADDIKNWWYLKCDIYGIIIATLLFTIDLGAKRWLRFVTELGFGLAISNVIDRVFFNTRDFTKSDILMILITVAVATYNLVYGNKQTATE